jgi:hypothetical protein
VSGAAKFQCSALNLVAEDARFELARGCPQHAFQACAIGQLGESSVDQSSDHALAVWTGRGLSLGLTTVMADPSCGAIPPNSPRAGRQQG